MGDYHDILVGCPVRSRSWILPRWFEAARQACGVAGLRPTFALLAPKGEPGLTDLARAHGQGAAGAWVLESDEPLAADKRDWDYPRFTHMAGVRNILLAHVRAQAPSLFWSLDSDILVDPGTLASALDLLEKFDAVGTKVYMEPYSCDSPSYGNLEAHGMQTFRPDAIGAFQVGVIMASKIMTPAAYAVDYRPHGQGEDVGWSMAARDAGLTLGWDGRVCSKHVMSPEHLDSVDPRIGW